MRALRILAGLIVLSCACATNGPEEATPEAIEASFVPYRGHFVHIEPVENFLRRRTATLVGAGKSGGVQGSAAALSTDGYYLTVAHALAAGPTLVSLGWGDERRSAPAREVWSDGKGDLALIHADLAPEACFDLAPEGSLPAGLVVLSYSHEAGPAGGRLELPFDPTTLGEYASAQIPHDTPLCAGHAGGPAVLLDGRLLGVEKCTDLDGIFLRRSLLVHPRAAELQRRIAEDRAARGGR